MTKRRFCEFLIKYKWIFIGLFAILTIAGCVLVFFTDIIYDLSSFLPAESDAGTGMAVLKEEFDDKGMMYVAVENVSEKEASKIASDLRKIDGVGNVVYIAENHYIDGNAMYTVSFDDYDSTSGCFAATESVIDFLSSEGYKAYYTGQSASSYYTKAETENSILKLGIVIVIIILAMLIFTGRSYFELVPMIITFGAAVALNMGTNFAFNAVGGISYISNLVSLVLQLALSIDYSVILIRRFMEEKALHDTHEAVVNAMSKGITEICSSSLTTIAGLVSLVFMALSIGREIGIALAKGIICSLVSVIFLMPALLTLFANMLEKTAHKSFVPDVRKFFSKVIKARYVLVPLFIVAIALAGAGQFFNVYSFNMNGGSYIINNNKKFEECGFGKLNSFVVVVPKGDYDKERELIAYVNGFSQIDEDNCNALAAIEIAEGIYLTDEFTKADLKEMFDSMTGESDVEIPSGIDIDYAIDDIFEQTMKKYPEGKETASLIDLLITIYDSNYALLLGSYRTMLGQLVYAKNNLESENYSRMTFNIKSGVESDETFEFIAEVKKGLADYYEEFYITGESVVCYDMAQYFPKDNMIVSLVTVFAVLFILLLTFKNFLIPVILILAIQGGIWLNFVIPFLSGTAMSFIGYLIINAIQMGATIDYAIVLTNRFNTIKKNYSSPLEAMAEAQNLVFPTIITSGVILTLTGAALALLSSGAVASMGSLLAIGTAFSMVIVLFVLPSLLLVTEKFYDKCYFRLGRKKAANEEAQEENKAEIPAE